jgi:hypothetical protein
VAPIGNGFRAAFNELYKDYITYVPNAHVQEIDPFAQAHQDQGRRHALRPRGADGAAPGR